MTESFEDRLQRLIRQVLDTRVDVLAIMMAEGGLPEDDARERLTELVDALRNPIIEETIFDGGRRLPTAVDEGPPTRIRLNSELLERVGDAEILMALARPISEVTALPSVAVSLAFQVDDDQSMRDLATRAHRLADFPIVRASSIPDWVAFRIEMLTDRLQNLCAHLGRASLFDTSGAETVHQAVAESESWPEWFEVSSLDWCADAVRSVEEALEGTKYEKDSGTLTELLWDSVALSPQSFLRHAGRTLRGGGGEIAEVGELLTALARALSSDHEFPTDIAAWPAYEAVYEAWENLNRHEKAMFGPVLLRDRTPPASVVEPARLAFGLDEPSELPWDAPLLCWTVREQTALRDLLIGFVKTLPGHTEDALEGESALHVQTERPLAANGDRRSVGIQVVSLNADANLGVPASFARAWSAAIHRMLDQFNQMATGEQVAVNISLRSAYDELFPDSKPIWKRRFYDIDSMGDLQMFKRLVTAPNDLFRTPVFFDPFHDPKSDELAPYPTLVFPVGVSGNAKVPFFIPVVALTSTMQGSPLRVRVVDVPPERDTACEWVCDRGLHLAKLSKQAVELILRSVRGDALQMAVFEA